jgi:hypothetical protein
VVNEEDLDADELEALKAVKKGYRYFARKLDDKEMAAIGDIRPKAIAAPAAAADGTVAASAAAVAAAAPVSSPPPGSDAGSGAAVSAASAWNTGGTYEERNLGAWFKDRLKELLREGRRDGSLCAPLPGGQRLAVSGVTGWGSSSADIVISRGKSRYVYDASFKVTFTLLPGGDAASASTTGPAGSGSGDDDVVMEDHAADEVGDDSKEKDKAGKPPRVHLHFVEVSNETEGAPREVRFLAGKPAPSAAQLDAARAALALDKPDAATGVAAAVRRVVEAVVQEFMAK